GARRILDQAKTPSRPSLQRQNCCCQGPAATDHASQRISAQAAASSNPIVVNRQPCGPQVLSWEVFGRRPSARTRIATTGPASEILDQSGYSLANEMGVGKILRVLAPNAGVRPRGGVFIRSRPPLCAGDRVLRMGTEMGRIGRCFRILLEY